VVEVAAPSGLAARRPAALAAGLAALVSLPALSLPFLSDDWAHLAALERGALLATPFGYSRPLSAMSFWIDHAAWGLSGPLFHLTNVLLIAAAAALVALLARRYTGDPRLAALTGCLFALHPSHVETAAWIAARSDPLYSVLALLAALAWERWRDHPRALPFAALALFEAALLAKESAVVLPAFLLVVELCRRPPRRPAVFLRGLLPMTAIALAHFLLVWSGGYRRTPLWFLGGLISRHRPGVLADYLTCAILPARTELIEDHPRIAFLLALLAGAALLALALRGARRIPFLVPAAGLGFLALLGPAIMSFQDRFLFLPVAASSLGLAALLAAVRPRARVAALVVLAAVWIPCLAERWSGWIEAGKESRLLIAALTEEGARPGTAGLFLVNMPHRVHGGPVYADFKSAVAIQGGPAIALDFATLVDYPRAAAAALDGPPAQSIVVTAAGVEVHLSVPPGPLSRLVWPLPDRPDPALAPGPVPVIVDAPGRVRVVIPAGADGRQAFVWSEGRLRRLPDAAGEASH
jgi:hypothetical protein